MNFSKQEAGAVVLFRPFHEVNGAWFWWYNKNPLQFKKLWRFWFNYLTKERGVHNLLYVFSPSSNTNRSYPWDYYPGDEYVVINALDFYSNDPFPLPNNVYYDMVRLGKPVGFSEIGRN